MPNPPRPSKEGIAVKRPRWAFICVKEMGLQCEDTFHNQSGNLLSYEPPRATSASLPCAVHFWIRLLLYIEPPPPFFTTGGGKERVAAMGSNVILPPVVRVAAEVMRIILSWGGRPFLNTQNPLSLSRPILFICLFVHRQLNLVLRLKLSCRAPFESCLPLRTLQSTRIRRSLFSRVWPARQKPHLLERFPIEGGGRTSPRS